MAIARPKTSPPKGPDLSDKEMTALRDVSKHHVVEPPMLLRLKKLGLTEQKSGQWATTQQGHIRLMFGAAH